MTQPDAIEKQQPQRAPRQESYLSLGQVDPVRTLSRLRYAPPVSVNQLLGYTLNESKGEPDLEELKLADKPIYFFQLEPRVPDRGFREYIGFVRAKLDGGDINRLLLSNSGDKHFHLDTHDVLQDWLLIDTPDYQVHMKSHFRALGLAWQISERDRLFFRSEIERWNNNRNSPEASKRKAESSLPGFIPVIRWGNNHWIFDYLEGYPYEGLRVGMADEFFPYNTAQKEAKWFNPTVGLWVVGHFVGTDFPLRVGLTSNGIERENSPSRAGVYTIRESYRFFESAFIQKAEQHIAENGIDLPYIVL